MRKLLLATLLLPGLLAAQAERGSGPEVLVDGKLQRYAFLTKANKPWRLCVLLPHGKDIYWWGVSWGADEQAKQLGVQLGIYQAGGYEHLETQRQQWRECQRLGADAYILGAIQASALRPEIDAALASNKPVVDLINGIDGAVSARSLVSFSEMAAAATQYLLRTHQSREFSLAWFPGPTGARWVDDGSAGLAAALRGTPVRLLDGGHGATDAKTQTTLVRALLDRHPRPDAMLGNAVAIEFASRLYAQRPPPRPKLVAYYATENVIKHIRDGKMEAAPTDQPVLQARIAIDLAVRALQGQAIPKLVSPRIEVLDGARLKTFDLRSLIPPEGQWMVQKALPPLP